MTDKEDYCSEEEYIEFHMLNLFYSQKPFED